MNHIIRPSKRSQWFLNDCLAGSCETIRRLSACSILALAGALPLQAQWVAPATTQAAATPQTADKGFHWIEPIDNYQPTDVLLDVNYTWVDNEGAGGLSAHANFGINPHTLLFVELSGSKGDDEFGMVSAGFGLRRLLPDEKTVIGLNAFYDGLQDDSGYSYSQIGLGAEISRGRWFADANWYLPVGDSGESHTTSHTTMETEDHGSEIHRHHHTETVTFEQSAMRGWDAEVGVEFFEKPRYVQALLAVGYYGAEDAGYDASGVKIRGEARIGKHLRVGAEWRQNGGEIDQEWRVGVSLQFALGKTPQPAPVAQPQLASVSRPVDPATDSAKSAKSVVPVLSGKSAKSVQPVQEAPPPEVYPPDNFFGLVYRTPWPTVLLRKSVHFKDSVDIEHRGAPICGCKGGGTLFFP